MTASYAAIIISNKASGLLCKTCGSLIGTPGKGKPRNCPCCVDLNTSDRAASQLAMADAETRDIILKSRTCPICQKVLRTEQGRNAHINSVHGKAAT